MSAVSTVTHERPPHAGRSDGLFLALLALLLGVFSLVNTLSTVDEWGRHGERLPFWEPFLWETSSILVILAVVPLFMAFTRRFWPLDPPWWRLGLLHAAALTAFSLIHVAGMGGLRWAVYELVGGRYSPLQPLRDFPYEFRKDALCYVGFVFLYVMWRAVRLPGEPAAAVAEPAAIEVRDGARRHFVPLSEVAFIEAAGNYVELHRGRTPILHRAPLSALERQLAGSGFVRIHRSRLVRRAAIAEVESKPSGDFLVRLADGRELQGSRRYRRPLLDPA